MNDVIGPYSADNCVNSCKVRPPPVSLPYPNVRSVRCTALKSHRDVAAIVKVEPVDHPYIH